MQEDLRVVPGVDHPGLVPVVSEPGVVLIDVHMRHLREKLEREPEAPELILTVRGVGYRIHEP